MALARKPFVVLDAEILSSSVWSQSPPVRLVWITLLVLCDTEGYVGASVPGIASAAGVTVVEAEEAIAILKGPDPYSRTKKDDGRRLEEAERGFKVLNFIANLDRLSAERTKARDRVRRFRERQKKREMADCNVTVPTGNRDQGEVRSEYVPLATIPVGREVVAPSRYEPARLPTDRAENEVTAEIQRLQNDLGGWLCKLSEHPKSDLMVPAWTRKVTAYDRKDGTKVNGVADYRTIRSIERLEKSIEDAKWWLEKLGAEDQRGA